MGKKDVYRQHHEKLTNIFENIEESKKQLAEGLINDASFLFAENSELIEVMEETGMVRIHPNNPARQITTEAAKQYLKNVNTYSNVIKALNIILNNNTIEEEDPFEKWMKEKQESQKE